MTGMVGRVVAVVKAVVDWVHNYPAMVGMIATTAVAVMSRVGFHLDAAHVIAMIVAADAVVFGWIHGNVQPVVPVAFKARRN